MRLSEGAVYNSNKIKPTGTILGPKIASSCKTLTRNCDGCVVFPVLILGMAKDSASISGELSSMAKNANVNRQMSIYKHRKKQASNDAQLLMNRIALLQKEEERARKKIDDTKDRASEIINMRGENEKKMKEYMSAGNEEAAMQKELQRKVKEKDAEGKRARQEIHGSILTKRREDAATLLTQKKQLTKFMLKEQEKDLKLKQKKRDEVRKMQEESRLKREAIKAARERKALEEFERKAAEEEAEARRAEKLGKLIVGILFHVEVVHFIALVFLCHIYINTIIA